MRERSCGQVKRLVALICSLSGANAFVVSWSPAWQRARATAPSTPHARRAASACREAEALQKSVDKKMIKFFFQKKNCRKQQYLFTTLGHNIPRVLFPRPRPLEGDSLPRSWAHSGETYNWRAAAPILVVFVLTATCIMHRQDLTRPRTHTTPLLATTRHSHLPLYSRPPTPTPSNTSFLANILALGYAFASSCA